MREPAKRDLVLFLPDRLVIVDHTRGVARRQEYELAVDGASTAGLPRSGDATRYRGCRAVKRSGDHEAGEFAATVRLAQESFRRGDLFEVVPGRMFFEPCPARPSEVFHRLRERNPAPYGALMNLGESEYLVSASPEMYVRVEGTRVETCPTSGPIARGRAAMATPGTTSRSLNPGKTNPSLPMATNAAATAKQRICVPGSVRVIGRRQ